MTNQQNINLQRRSAIKATLWTIMYSLLYLFNRLLQIDEMISCIEMYILEALMLPSYNTHSIPSYIEAELFFSWLIYGTQEVSILNICPFRFLLTQLADGHRNMLNVCKCADYTNFEKHFLKLLMLYVLLGWYFLFSYSSLVLP